MPACLQSIVITRSPGPRGNRRIYHHPLFRRTGSCDIIYCSAEPYGGIGKVYYQEKAAKRKRLTMHELSIVMGIVDIAAEQARNAGAASVEEIELDIGMLSTIEMNAFEFAWQQGVKDTILGKAVKKVNRIKGTGRCMDCNASFPLEQLYDPCPVCGEYLVDILAGKELRVRSLVVS